MTQLDRQLIADAEEAIKGNFAESIEVAPTEVLQANEVWLSQLSALTQVKALLMQGLDLENIEELIGIETFTLPEAQFQIGLYHYRVGDFESAIKFLEPLALAGDHKARTYLLMVAIKLEDKAPDFLRRCIEDVERHPVKSTIVKRKT